MMPADCNTTRKTISILVDEIPQSVDEGSKRAAFDVRSLVQNQGQKLLKLELDTLTAGLEHVTGAVVDAIGGVDISQTPYKLSTVSFTLAVTSTGEVALLSSIKGACTPQFGITFTLEPREKQT